MKRLIAMLGVFLFLQLFWAQAADYPSREQFEKRTYSSDTGSMPYRLFKPVDYSPDSSYPLVIFLHGSGEKGTDNEKQLNNNGNGSLWLVNTEYQQSHPMFFCAPQSNSWATNDIVKVKGIIDSLIAEFPGIDPERIIITGLSMGGAGTYLMMATYPDIIAGAVPMQGPNNWKAIAEYKNLNIWHFHAANDPNEFQRISTADYCVKYLRTHGLNVVYTRYDTGGHTIWARAYKTPPLIDWIYNVRRGVSYTGSPYTKIKTNNGEKFTTNTNTVALAGTSGGIEALINKAEYFNTRNTSMTGIHNGTNEWGSTNIPLKTGENNILNVAYGTSWSASYGGNTSSAAVINVTYDPNYNPSDPNNRPIIESLYAEPHEITLPQSTVNLSVFASDEDGDALTCTWTKTTGAGNVEFTDVNAPETTASFSVAGEYKITVEISDGREATSNSLTITVNPAPNAPNHAPVISQIQAASPHLFLPANTTSLSVTASDEDGDALIYQWASKASGVTFSNINSQNSDVVFAGGGVYEISVTVSDGELSTSANIRITVNEAPIDNVINVALNKPVTSDSEYNASYTGDKAVDGNVDDVTSRWLSEDTGNPHWIEIDLQGEYELSSIKLWSGYMQHGFAVANYDFQIWDGSDWTSIVNVSDNAAQYKEHTFTPCTTSKVRLLCGGEDLARVYELEVYGKLAVVSVPENVVLNKPVKADSTYTDAYTPEMAVDGDSSSVASRWLSKNDGNPHWIEIDLQGEYAISEAKLWMGFKTLGYAIGNYQIQVWKDDDWLSVVTVAGNSEQYLKHSFTETTTSKIRLLCGSEDMARLYEIEVTGIPAD